MNTIHVHQIWLQGRAAIPQDIRLSLNTWFEATKSRNTFRYVLWDDASIRDLLPRIAFPRIRTIYESIPETLYGIRADIARLVVLFHFGGLYADADTRVLKPEPLLDHFEKALLADRYDAVVGAADLCGCTRRWVEVTRRPSNFLLGCRDGSAFIERYLNSVVRDFDTLRILDHLARADEWSWYDRLRITKRWTGPKKLRLVLRSTPQHLAPVRLTPIGFVASGYQRCFPDAVVAHDYKAKWYRASRTWKSARNIAVYALLRTPLDACIIVLLLLAFSIVAVAFYTTP